MSELGVGGGGKKVEVWGTVLFRRDILRVLEASPALGEGPSPRGDRYEMVSRGDLIIYPLPVMFPLLVFFFPSRSCLRGGVLLLW